MKVAGKRSAKAATGARKGSSGEWQRLELDFNPSSGVFRVRGSGVSEDAVREAFRAWLGGSPAVPREADRTSAKRGDVTVPLSFSLSPYNGDAFLTALRGERTQEAFSRATGLPQSTISAIESGRRKLNLGHLGSIAESLGTSADAFLSRGAVPARSESDAGYLGKLLEELLRIQRLSHADFGTRIRGMLELDGKAMHIARVSYWRRSADKRAITCEAASFQDGRGSTIEGTELNEVNYGAYFKALARQEPIAATDALTDRRTSAFGPAYLKPAGIGAMLDVPVFVGGAFMGIICHEHVGGPREWRTEEQQFAVAVAGALAAAIEGERNSRIEAAFRGA